MNFPPPDSRQARVLWFSLTAVAVALVIALVVLLMVVLGWVVQRLSPVLLPLALAAIVAYLLDPVVTYLARKGIPRLRAILLVFLAGAVLVFGLLVTVVPPLVIQSQKFIEEIPANARQFQQKVNDWMKESPLKVKIWNTLRAPGTNAPPALAAENAAPTVVPSEPPLVPPAVGDTLMEWFSQAAPVVLAWLSEKVSRVASWLGLLAGLALVPVYVFYFLLERAGISKHWPDYLPVRESRLKQEMVFVISAINDCLIVFFRSQVLVAMCVGALLTLGFWLIGLKYALLLGVISGLLGIIPYLGVMVSIIPAVLIAVVQFGTWWHPLLVLGVIATVQMLEGLFISPKIMGDRVGLHPLTIIIAVMVGTVLLGGILGGLLAIPLTAVLRTLMFRYVWRKPLSASRRPPERELAEPVLEP